MKLLNELINNSAIINHTGDLDKEISSVEYDSRKCEKGSLFVAIRGYETDGHKYLANAIKRGAKAVVCESLSRDIGDFEGITFIKVENSRQALAEISHNFYDNPSSKLRVIGITGTNGKTTITFLLKSILEKAGEKVGLIGTTGIFIGDKKLPATHTTPESRHLAESFSDMLNQGVTSAIIEVSSHSLIQDRVHGIEFDGAIFTNLTHDHMDYHATVEEYASAKRKLFEMLPADSVAIVYGDDEYSDYMLDTCNAGTKLRLGRVAGNDILIIHEEILPDSSAFTLDYKGEKGIKIKTPLSGRFNIDNAAVSAALCLELGVSTEQILAGLGTSRGAPGRMQKVKIKNGAIGIVDYAHTPDALEKALEACREVLPKNGRLICVFGCGGDRDKKKRPVMGKIAARLADNVVITSDNPRNEDADKIIGQIYKGISLNDKSKTMQVAHRAEAIEYAVRFSEKDDIVLVAGKGHETYQLIEGVRNHFDDVEELEKYSEKIYG